MIFFSDQTAPHQLSFEAYGVEARICANSPDILARAQASCLPPGWRPVAPQAAQHRLGIVAEEDGTFSAYDGGNCASERGGLDLALVVLDSQVRGYVALRSPDKTFIHAGVVGHAGRTLVLPGHSFAGKTTLVAALVRAGALYFSDEFAVLDDDGFVHPYAKPLSLRPPEGMYVERDVYDLGGIAGEERLPLGMVVITYFRAGAEWRPERLSTGASALRLLAHTVTARAQPDLAMRAIARAVEGASALEGERGEADEIAGHLLERLRAGAETAA